ncbi:YraN family protein [Fusicatenibacter sp.]
MNQREVGTRQENRAAEYLETLGYHILERNFRCRFGEIDLIAKQEDTYVFIEVKYRAGRMTGDPASAVDWKKQRKISKTADYYRMLHKIPVDQSCRFDVVAETPEEIHVYANAFYYQGSGW